MVGSGSPRILYECCPMCDSRKITRDRIMDCTSRVSFSNVLPRLVTWMKCGECGHSFTDGYFSEPALEELLRYLHESQVFRLDDAETMRQVTARMVQRVVEQTSITQGKWLDVGFGNASLLLACEEFGFEPVGYDLRQETVDAINKYGYDFLCGEISRDTLYGGYSVISLADVLEHTPYPLDVLRDAHRLLRQGGAIFVSCPNCESFVWRVLTEANANPYWTEVEHYHNFGRKQLFGILEKLGFNSLTYGISDRYRMGMEITAIKN